MRRFVFNLDIPADQYLAYYKGQVTKVVARMADGSTVQFPALLLRDVVTQSGVRGRFELTCEENMKGAKIRRLG